MLMLWVSLVTIGHQTDVLKAAIGPLTSCQGIELAANKGFVVGLRLAVKTWGKFLRVWCVCGWGRITAFNEKPGMKVL